MTLPQLAETEAIQYTLLGTLLTTLFMSIEYLCMLKGKRFSAATFFSWEISSTRPGWLFRGPRLRLLNGLFEDRPFKFLIVLRILVAISVFFNPGNHLFVSSCLAILFLINCLLNIRHFQGRDGADETLSILLFGLFVYYAVDPELSLRWAGPLFIVAQLSLSYFISGYYKLMSGTWRSGQSIKKVVATEIYGQPSLSFLVRHQLVGYACCWLIILWELSFPLLFLISAPYALIWLILGVIFHLSMAVIMGLNTFMMAFLISYPLFYYILVSL
ncbi:hypothetical protein ACSBL2_15865 [Pedobacter sp. AW31-3R]|uniref:hypothetical protein n=1 Tax=Pedobacter sp. AW31-3R TaxID=3445781 RepID=UPI003F9FD6C3